MNWYLEVLKKYAVFNGRARRKELWFFVLFNIIASIILRIVDGVLGISIGGQGGVEGVGILSLIYLLGVIIPSIAVTVRRLHDIDKSGWWFLIVFVPLIGGIVLIIFNVLPGTQGPNRFGEDPIK